jgi:hypothetical protein
VDLTTDDVTPDDVLEMLGRFLPPGRCAAYVDRKEYVVRWQALPDGPLATIIPRKETVVRSRVSFEEALHRLIGECAPVVLAYRQIRTGRAD